PQREGGAPGSTFVQTTAAGLEPAEAKFVSCSFCGRQPPEAGRLVSGSGAFICEHCTRQWAHHLGRPVISGSILRPGVAQRRAAVRPTGPPPEDQDAARAAISVAFTSRSL